MFVDQKKFRQVMEGWAEWACQDVAGARGYPTSSAFVRDKIDGLYGPMVPIDSCELFEQVEVYVCSMRVVDPQLVSILRAHWEAEQCWLNLDQKKKAAMLGISHGTFRNELGKANTGVQAYMGRDCLRAVATASLAPKGQSDSLRFGREPL